MVFHMKIIVVYKSNTGFTEAYANWIATRLQCEAVTWKQFMKKQAKDYDAIIYGQGLFAGKLPGLEKMKLKVGTAKLVVFATGATPMNATPMIEKVKNDNLTAEEQTKIPFFYFEGGINEERMGFFSKKIIHMLVNSLKKKENRTEEEEGMLATLSHSENHAKEEYIEPLITCIHQLGA